MTKYRIRLANGRIIGPFVLGQLIELKQKGRISGTEEAQVYPMGSWLPIHQQEFYSQLEQPSELSGPTGTTNENTFVIDLAKLRQAKLESEVEKLDLTSHTPVEPMTETMRMGQTQKKSLELELDRDDVSHTQVTPSKNEERQLNTDLLKLMDPDRHDKTLINPIAQEEIARMRRQQEEERKAEEARRKAAEAEQQLVVHQPVSVPMTDEHTQMFTLDSVKEDLLLDAQEEEKVIAKELKAYKKKKADEEGLYIKDSQEDEEEEEDPAKQKRKRLIMIALGLVLVYVFLFPADDKPKQAPFVHENPVVIFPEPFDRADVEKSKLDFQKGMEFFLKGTYVDIIRAGIMFKSSYEQNMENTQALHFMVRAYAEQLRFSKQRLTDAHTVFNILRGKRPLLIEDPNGVIGVNLFYMAINKPEAAADVIAKYLRLNPKNVTQDLFAAYLLSLMETGQLDVARKFYEGLAKAPDKTRYALEALIKYHQLNQENEKAWQYIDEGLQRFPHLVNFQLLKAEQLVWQKQFDAITPILRKVDELNLENNDHYRARFLMIQGLQMVSSDPQNAIKFLSASLKLEDSTDLRMKLAELQDQDGPGEAGKLIAESKAIKHINLAKLHYRKKNYELALSNAAKASDIFLGYIPGELLLAKVQLKLGLAAKAVATLEALEGKYPDNPDIMLELIDAYIETYKFNQAKQMIGKIAQTPLKSTYHFASANAKLYLRMGDNLQAISWFKNSINLNPINDSDMFLMAELLIKRANFDAARTILNKCIELDPNRPEYRIAYSKIIYETQDDQAAVGYLLGLLDDFTDNPQILSEIAIFYYRAGKVKDFEAFKARIEKIPSRDRTLYDFLIRAAQLDERYNDIPVYVEKLIEIEPGALDAMMVAGRTMFENGRLVEAARWFLRIKEKMPSYPKVQYYTARIAMLSGDLEKAMKEVDSDIADNGETDITMVLKAQILVIKNELVEAENLFKRAQKINPRSYDALVGLADISTKRNSFDLSLDLYKRALRERADEPTLHKKIGDVYRLLGQGALAIEAYKMYLEMNPEAQDKNQIEAYIKLMQ
jgi:tetratricopeptide (TPR) repeat protein